MKTSPHAMTSEVASHKKKKGHARELLRTELLGEGSQVITGTGKADVIRKDGKTESVKGGKKTQWALYTLNRIVSDQVFSEDENTLITKWVNFLPDNKEEWETNRSKYRINPNISSLVEIFRENPMKLVDYFCGVNIVDILVTLDSRDNTWMETPMDVFSKKISESIKNVYFTKGGKLVIKGGKKNTILFEMELRKGNGSHKRVLFHSHIHRIIDCLK
jgi:hypothetical protein